MIGLKSSQRYRRKKRTRAHPRIVSNLIVLLLSVSFVSVGRSQNLVNSGTITNPGTMKVRNQVTGLPAAIDGVFEYFGANQDVPASQYRNLVLSGSGTKTTVGGDFTVTDSVLIANSVTLRVGTGSALTLNGNLLEQGYLAGKIRKSVDLSGSTTSSNFGNIGAVISWSGTPLGQTSVLRGSDSALTGNGNQSIKRYYDIFPTTNSGLSATFVFSYSDVELNGHDPAILLLWRSVDSGATWRRQGGTVLDTSARTITKTGVSTFSLWTAGDSLNPLGPLTPEGVASSLALTSGNNQVGTVATTLSTPFVVRVSDISGNPVQGTSVSFAILTVPSGAAGQSLSVTNTTTAANGEASTILTLGDKIGTYTVTASSAGLAGSPVAFTTTATAAAARTVALTSGNNQSSTVAAALTNPFIVTVRDTFGNPVQGTSVSFAIVTVPSGAAGQSLSVTNTTTAANGEASTILTLGDKISTYTVTASSAGLAGSPVAFTTTATAAAARTIALTAGSNQTDTVGQTLPNAFVVMVSDTFGNPVQGIGVTFAIDSIPSGATGQSLSVTSTTTDAAGSASTFLTLGSRMGRYTINATSVGLLGSPLTFAATAVAGSQAYIPSEFRLFQNYPNPFNPSTEIQFDVKERGRVQLIIYDMLGRVVEILVDETRDGPARYKAGWNANSRATGVYFARLVIEPENRSIPTFVSVKRMLLLK